MSEGSRGTCTQTFIAELDPSPYGSIPQGTFSCKDGTFAGCPGSLPRLAMTHCDTLGAVRFVFPFFFSFSFLRR